MRSVLKLALVGAVLVAPSAWADVVAPDTGNGELVLYVRDLSNPNRVYARGLQISIDQVITQSVTGGAYSGQGQAVNYVLPTIVADDTLNTFLSAPSSSGYAWTIAAGDTVGGNNLTDQRRYLTTTQQDVSTTPISATNTNLSSGWSGLVSLTSSLNTELPDFAGSSTQPNGQWGQNANNAENWFGFGPNTDNARGSAANFYAVTSRDGNNGQTARVFQFADVIMETNGTVHGVDGGVPGVPIPAALWLFGSGIAGLTAIGRRRKASAVAA